MDSSNTKTPTKGNRLPMRSKWALARRSEAVLTAAIAAVVFTSALTSPENFSLTGLLSYSNGFVVLGIVALALTPTLICAEIDLSVASVVGLSAVCFAWSWNATANIVLSVVVCLAVATALGLINGVLIAVLELPSIAVTIGTLIAFRGLAFVVSGTGSVGAFPDVIVNLGFGKVPGTPIPVGIIILLLIALCLGVCLRTTPYGRYIYAIGQSREVARFSGVPVRKIRIAVFGLSGFLTGLAALVFAGFYNSINASAADGILLPAVTIVVLGGVSIFGGAGTIFGVILAWVLASSIQYGMGVANVAGPIQLAAIGMLLLISIGIGNVVRRRSET